MKRRNNFELHEKVLRNVGKNLRARRKEVALSQSALSRQSGITLSTINEIENLVSKDIRLSTLSALADALSTSPDALIQGLNFPTQPEMRDDFKTAIALLEGIYKKL